ncbi:MAG TPA: hypothetical protein VJ927_02030 [Actinomycetota bacterium]|nr:hypothetical protein [Actinomycetota bacterium]
MNARRVRAAFIVAGLMFLAVPALAGTPDTVLDLRRDRDVLWAEASVGNGEASIVKVLFLAPRRDGRGHKLWQVCRFDHDGARVYRCGIDVSPRSAASRHAGDWTVKVRLDGEEVAVKTFAL